MINEGWAFFCIIGFWGWVLCTMGFIVKSFPTRDAFRGSAALRWGGAVVAFYALWIAGMLNA